METLTVGEFTIQPGMRILGIDPGTQVVGYGCLELSERAPPAALSAPEQLPLAHQAANVVAGQPHVQVAVVAQGALRLGRRNDPLPVRLRNLADGLSALLADLRPDEIALEEAFYGKSVQSALRIGEARGVIMAEASRRGVAVLQFPPARIKRAVTGHGAASKDQVCEMVVRLLGLPAPPEPRDVSDALAAAVCRAEQRRDLLP
jgi:crossover junction endodeoxyribonuclease RuvC